MSGRWTVRILALALSLGLLNVTRPWWAAKVGHSLVCSGSLSHSDAILIENLESKYLLFERAAALQRGGFGSKVFVLVQATGENAHVPGLVPAGIVDVMSRVAQLQHPELIPVQLVEPITLTAAYQAREVFERSQVGSVIVVADAFRSRRTSLVYQKALEPSGITVRCDPVGEPDATPETWTRTWHGIQEVLLQETKLQYYRARFLWWKPRPSAGPAA